MKLEKMLQRYASSLLFGTGKKVIVQMTNKHGTYCQERGKNSYYIHVSESDLNMFTQNMNDAEKFLMAKGLIAHEIGHARYSDYTSLAGIYAMADSNQKITTAIAAKIFEIIKNFDTGNKIFILDNFIQYYLNKDYQNLKNSLTTIDACFNWDELIKLFNELYDGIFNYIYNEILKGVHNSLEDAAIEHMMSSAFPNCYCSLITVRNTICQSELNGINQIQYLLKKYEEDNHITSYTIHDIRNTEKLTAEINGKDISLNLPQNLLDMVITELRHYATIGYRLKNWKLNFLSKNGIKKYLDCFNISQNDIIELKKLSQYARFNSKSSFERLCIADLILENLSSLVIEKTDRFSIQYLGGMQEMIIIGEMDIDENMLQNMFNNGMLPPQELNINVPINMPGSPMQPPQSDFELNLPQNLSDKLQNKINEKQNQNSESNSSQSSPSNNQSSSGNAEKEQSSQSDSQSNSQSKQDSSPSKNYSGKAEKQKGENNSNSEGSGFEDADTEGSNTENSNSGKNSSEENGDKGQGEKTGDDSKANTKGEPGEESGENAEGDSSPRQSYSSEDADSVDDEYKKYMEDTGREAYNEKQAELNRLEKQIEKEQKDEFKELINSDIPTDSSSGEGIAPNISSGDLPNHKNINTRYYPSDIMSKNGSSNEGRSASRIFENVKSDVTKFSQKLKKILMFETVQHTVKGLRDGKLNTAALYRSQTDLKSFKKKKRGESKKAKIVVLIDQSGSMCGDKMSNTIAAAQVLLKACQNIKIPIAIFGHNDSYNGSINLFNYCNFSNYQNKEVNNILYTAYSDGSNRDGLAIFHCLKYLAAHGNSNKENLIFLIISDGAPAASGYGGESAFRDIQSIYTKFETERQIKTIGIGIGDDTEHIPVIYKDFLIVPDVKSLGDELLKILKKLVI